jgi:hypothetical protein
MCGKKNAVANIVRAHHPCSVFDFSNNKKKTRLFLHNPKLPNYPLPLPFDKKLLVFKRRAPIIKYTKNTFFGAKIPKYFFFENFSPKYSF